MIRNAGPEEKQTLYSWWKEAFKDDDGGTIDDYFAHDYDPSESYVLEQDGEIVSSLQCREKTLNLYQHNLKVSYLVGVVTPPQHRHKGYMRTLLEGVLADVSHRHLMTILQAYHPEIYQPFGFEQVMDVRVYELARWMMPYMDLSGVSVRYTIVQLLSCYRQFAAHFTGYIVRDETLMEARIRQHLAQGGTVWTYQRNRECLAYALVTVHESVAEIDECCYLDSDGLIKLLNAAFQRATQVHLTTTLAEHIRRIIPDAVVRTQPWLMARIHQRDLFRDLYHVRILYAYSAFNAFPVPLFNRDYQ